MDNQVQLHPGERVASFHFSFSAGNNTFTLERLKSLMQVLDEVLQNLSVRCIGFSSGIEEYFSDDYSLRDILGDHTRKQVTDGKLPVGFNQMLAALRDREAIKDTFGRFVSQEVAEAVLNGRIPINGDRREVSILFQDMRGFTSMAEQMDPEVLAQVLNQFFTEMAAAVQGEGGVVKQFVGDGLMALFGAPMTYHDHAERAVRAALGMVARLEGLNARLGTQGRPPIQIGVGIHTGEVVAGEIGSDTRVEYAVVGDAVNLASRMEGLTKEMQTTILISEVTAAGLGPGFTLGRTAMLPIKGKTKPVGVAEVLGYKPGIAPAVKPSLETKGARGVSQSPR